jgi:sulfofructose kinase
MNRSGDARPLVICLGHVVADHSFRVDEIPQPPAKAIARSYSLGPGGMAATAAMAVARLGGRAAYWGRVGEDMNGPPLLAALAEEGVDIAGTRRIPGGRTSVSAVLVDRVGERVTLNYRGENLGTDPSWLPLPALREAGALLCDPRWPEAAALALAEARRLGLPSVLDAERSETRILVDLVPRAEHAVFSVTGLQNFAPGAAPADGLRRALDSRAPDGAGPRLAAVTRGEHGVLWMTQDDPEPREAPAFNVLAANTTGAGDVFHGAYALALAEGTGVAEAMRFASATGALRVRDGASPTRGMVEEMLRG